MKLKSYMYDFKLLHSGIATADTLVYRSTFSQYFSSIIILNMHYGDVKIISFC